MQRRRSFKAATAVAAATAVGLLANMSPALAQGAGVSVGSSNITASGPISNPLCIKTVSSPVITLINVGTVGAVNAPVVGVSGTAAEYVGPSKATINLPQFYFGPEGTYRDGSPPACANPLLPAAPQAVPVTSWSLVNTTVNGVGGVGTISNCGGSGGTYIRVADTYKIQVSGVCTVTDAVTTATETTTFVFTGNQNPCLGDFGVPNCEGVLDPTEFEGVYAQSPGALPNPLIP